MFPAGSQALESFVQAARLDPDNLDMYELVRSALGGAEENARGEAADDEEGPESPASGAGGTGERELGIYSPALQEATMEIPRREPARSEPKGGAVVEVLHTREEGAGREDRRGDLGDLTSHAQGAMSEDAAGEAASLSWVDVRGASVTSGEDVGGASVTSGEDAGRSSDGVDIRGNIVPGLEHGVIDPAAGEVRRDASIPGEAGSGGARGSMARESPGEVQWDDDSASGGVAGVAGETSGADGRDAVAGDGQDKATTGLWGDGPGALPPSRADGVLAEGNEGSDTASQAADVELSESLLDVGVSTPEDAARTGTPDASSMEGAAGREAHDPALDALSRATGAVGASSEIAAREDEAACTSPAESIGRNATGELESGVLLHENSEVTHGMEHQARRIHADPGDLRAEPVGTSSPVDAEDSSLLDTAAETVVDDLPSEAPGVDAGGSVEQLSPELLVSDDAGETRSNATAGVEGTLPPEPPADTERSSTEGEEAGTPIAGDAVPASASPIDIEAVQSIGEENEADARVVGSTEANSSSAGWAGPEDGGDGLGGPGEVPTSAPLVSPREHDGSAEAGDKDTAAESMEGAGARAEVAAEEGGGLVEKAAPEAEDGAGSTGPKASGDDSNATAQVTGEATSQGAAAVHDATPSANATSAAEAAPQAIVSDEDQRRAKSKVKLGLARLAKGQTSNAAALFDKAASLDPNWWGGYYHAAVGEGFRITARAGPLGLASWGGRAGVTRARG